MTDSIQKSSSIPLPDYQTGANARDPVPVSSPATATKSAADRSAADAAVKDDTFKDYLDQTGISVVEKAKPKPTVDAADLVTQGSVYGSPDGSRPI